MCLFCFDLQLKGEDQGCECCHAKTMTSNEVLTAIGMNDMGSGRLLYAEICVSVYLVACTAPLALIYTFLESVTKIY